MRYNNFLQQKIFVNSQHAKKCVKTLALSISQTQIWYCPEFYHYTFKAKNYPHTTQISVLDKY